MSQVKAKNLELKTPDSILKLMMYFFARNCL
jgi:hypothetical protein